MLIESILQYFPPSLSYHLSLRPLLCPFLSGHLRQTLCRSYLGGESSSPPPSSAFFLLYSSIALLYSSLASLAFSSYSYKKYQPFYSFVLVAGPSVCHVNFYIRGAEIPCPTFPIWFHFIQEEQKIYIYLSRPPDKSG